MPEPRIHRLMPDSLRYSAERLRDKVAITDANGSLTYVGLLSAARRLAEQLASDGIVPGDRIAVHLENSTDAATAVYGCWLAGGVLVMVNPRTPTEKLAAILDDSGARTLITEPHCIGRLSEGLSGTRLRTVCGPDGSCLMNGSEGSRRTQPPQAQGAATVIATDLAALIYTSGSSGEPKGVMHSHQTMLFAVQSIAEYLRLREADRILNVLPLSFDYGLYQLLMAIHLGATLILEQGFAFPAKVFDAIRREQATVVPAVPTLFSMIIEADSRKALRFPSVTTVTNTAAALPDHFIDRLTRIFPSAALYCMYGLTECKRVSYLPPEQLHRKRGSVGVAIPGTAVSVLREDGTPVSPGETGILHVRGPHVMLGYWNRPAQTAEMLQPGRWPGERVLCTHDLFRVDEEGFLYFVSRSDEIIKSRGEKVSPTEVESALCSIDGVHQAAVIGIPDPVVGSAICAFIVPQPEATLTPRALRARCTELLEPHAVPQRLELVESLPRTGNGKVDKTALIGRLPSVELPARAI